MRKRTAILVRVKMLVFPGMVNRVETRRTNVYGDCFCEEDSGAAASQPAAA